MKLVLTGFMATGKSTVARHLARRLQWPLIDCDAEISARAGKPIQQIFRDSGEVDFRALESSIIAEIASDRRRCTQCGKPLPAVIATGGGAIVDPRNYAALREAGLIVCLTARPDVIARRVASGVKVRPMLSRGSISLRQQIAELMETRREAYARATLTIDTSDRTLEEVVEAILDAIAARYRLLLIRPLQARIQLTHNIGPIGTPTRGADPEKPGTTNSPVQKVEFIVELGSNSYPVHVGRRVLPEIGRFARACGLTASRCALITDSNVGALYSKPVLTSLEAHGFQPELIEIAPGEPSKSLAVLQRVYQRLAEAELDRDSAIFALGGGVVGDLAGFAAATYLRGLSFIQVPTSMVAQVDSALGGKTAVNLAAGKNLIGSFYQPRLIVADVETLTSLPDREFREGLAEVIKYGAIADAAFLEWLEQEMPMILARDADRLGHVVERSLRHKAAIVSQDEREGGLRKTLNFGHTLGHALEASTAYGKYLHGEAVAIGMVAAARLSTRRGGLRAEDAERLRNLLEAAGLMTDLPEGWLSGEFIRALRLDKKRRGNTVEFVLLDRLGHALTRKLSFDEIVGEKAQG